MGTKTAKKAGVRFTFWYRGQGFTTIRAGSLNEADQRSGRDSDLIIRGTARNIGIQSIGHAGTAGKTFMDVQRIISRWALCTIEIGGSIRIANAQYGGRRTIGGDSFLTFSKNGFRFLTYAGATRFVMIDFNKL